MGKIRKALAIVIGLDNYQRMRNMRVLYKYLPSLMYNFYIDFILYYKHSNLFKKDTFNKIEASIILKYHSLEKGFLHSKMKNNFGRSNVESLIVLLKREDVIANRNRTQIAAAYLAICTYYELHNVNKRDISIYYTVSNYNFFKNYTPPLLKSVKNKRHSTFFNNSSADFFSFSSSRASVRSFNSEKIPFSKIEKVIELAKNAPSVCNRQSNKVYYTENKKIINDIFEIQGGLTGYSNNISQLFVVCCDRNYFYSVGERNQLFIDGGMFLMNLLYALHFYKIGACPAHWALNNQSDNKIKKMMKMSSSEKVIALVPIGIPNNDFKTCLSLRRSNDELLKIVP